MTFTSADTHHLPRLNQEILRILQVNRGEWMSAQEISRLIRGNRGTPHTVGQVLKYLVDEFPIESCMFCSNIRKYRYTPEVSA